MIRVGPPGWVGLSDPLPPVRSSSPSRVSSWRTDPGVGNRAAAGEPLRDQLEEPRLRRPGLSEPVRGVAPALEQDVRDEGIADHRTTEGVAQHPRPPGAGDEPVVGHLVVVADGEHRDVRECPPDLVPVVADLAHGVAVGVVALGQLGEPYLSVAVEGRREQRFDAAGGCARGEDVRRRAGQFEFGHLIRRHPGPDGEVDRPRRLVRRRVAGGRPADPPEPALGSAGPAEQVEGGELAETDQVVVGVIARHAGRGPDQPHPAPGREVGLGDLDVAAARTRHRDRLGADRRAGSRPAS